nr:putative late blight resistance protein homolog R1B-8 [Ipomoea batatas]GMD58418.1 putative late blight resistance protein homolog R1B-8 [Ipomoea batatas]
MTIVVDTVLEDQVAQGVNALVRIVSDNVTLVRGINSEIKDLTSDIQMFNARLIEASKNPRANDHQVLRLIVNKFRSVVNEAEDTIADYVVLKKKHGNNFFLKSLDKTPICGKVNGYASEIQSIRTKMNAIRQDHEKEVQDLMQYEIKEQDKAVKTFHQQLKYLNVWPYGIDGPIVRLLATSLENPAKRSMKKQGISSDTVDIIA